MEPYTAMKKFIFMIYIYTNEISPSVWKIKFQDDLEWCGDWWTTNSVTIEASIEASVYRSNNVNDLAFTPDG